MTVFSMEGVNISWMEDWSVFLEFFFFFSMVIGFLTDFKKPGDHTSEKKLSVISKRYLREDFLLDFIPLFPFPEILRWNKLEHKFSFILKIMRIHKGQKALDIK